MDVVHASRLQLAQHRRHNGAAPGLVGLGRPVQLVAHEFGQRFEASDDLRGELLGRDHTDRVVEGVEHLVAAQGTVVQRREHQHRISLLGACLFEQVARDRRVRERVDELAVVGQAGPIF